MPLKQLPLRWQHLLGLALVAALCWQLAHWTWIFVAPAPQPSIAPSAVPNTEQVLEAVRSAHLFGVASASATQSRPSTTLNLRLSGVFAANGRLSAVAIIRVEGKGELPFMPGDRVLADVTLEEVRPDHVLLRRGAATERLDLERKTASLGTRAAAAQVRVNPEGPGRFSVARSELSRMLSDPAQLANVGHVKAVPGVGVSIEEIGPDTLLSRLGLQKGDVIRRINDRSVEQAADLLQGYRERLVAGGGVKVQGTRNGQPFEYNYSVN